MNTPNEVHGVCIVCGSDLLVKFTRGCDLWKFHCNKCGSEVTEIVHDSNQPNKSKVGFSDAVRIARGCLDYGGGHRADDGHLEIYHHGIQTVINALEAVEKHGLDSQSQALWNMGKATSCPQR